MHIDRISSHQGSHVSYLLRQSYRDQGKVKHRTLANLTPLPMAAIDAVRQVLKGRPVLAAPVDDHVGAGDGGVGW